MVEKIDKALEVVFKIMKVLLILVLVSMVVILMAHIIFRYVLNNSLTWSEELLKIMLVWFGMMSVAVLAARREHVAIVVFKEHMPKKVQNFLTKLTQLIIVGICILHGRHRHSVLHEGRIPSDARTQDPLCMGLRGNTRCIRTGNAL